MGRPEKPLDGDQDPARRRLALWLRQQRRQSGLTMRELAIATTYSSSTLSRAAGSGRQLPTRQVVTAFARACGADLAIANRLWRKAHHTHHLPRRTHRSPLPGSRLKPQAVQTFDHLRQAMLEMRRRAGMPTYAVMEARAKQIGASLPHTSLWKVLRDDAEIHKPHFLAFLHACDIPAHQHSAWEAAWERANSTGLTPMEINKAIKDANAHTMVRIIDTLTRLT